MRTSMWLQYSKFCRMKFGNFDSVRLFLHSLGAIEKKKRELDSDFHKVLEIWNKVLPSQNPPPTSQKTQQLKKNFKNLS